MPRPISLRSVSSLSGSIDESSILYNGIEDAYLSATTNTSIASRSQRHLSDDFTQHRRQRSFQGRRIRSLPYVPDNSFRRNSMDLSVLKEKDQMNEFTRKGKDALFEFFDPNESGSVWPLNTFTALRKLGFDKLSGILISSFCHLLLAYPLRIVTRKKENNILRWVPDPMMRVRTEDVKNFNTKISASEAKQLIDQYSFGVRCYSRLRHLHQVDTVDGFGIAIEMRHTAGYGAIITFPFIFMFFRLLLPRHSGKTSVEDILNALNGTYFYLLAIRAKQTKPNLVVSTPRKNQHRYPNPPNTA